MSNHDLIELTVYIRGQHSQNPALFVKALDPVNLTTLGGSDVYPGMQPTDTLEPDTIYAVPIRFRLNQVDPNLDRPYQLQLAMGWRTDDFLPLSDANDLPLESLLLPGPVLQFNTLAQPSTPVDVLFGEQIRLAGYHLPPQSPVPGDNLELALRWRYLKPLSEDWTLALGLLNSSGEVVVQADGMIPGYPTSAWQLSPDFDDKRILTIPTHITSGTYRLYVGWYRLSDGERLQPVGSNVEGDLWIMPQPITISSR